VRDATKSVIAALAFAGMIVAATGWYREHVSVHELGLRVAASELMPIARLLKENRALMQQLEGELAAEKDSSILQDYLTKVRRDGIANCADLKRQLDQIADNNASIAAFIEAYSPHATTATFTSEADKFRTYASAWRDRWDSMLELFMAGGNYPAAQIPFPSEFSAAVEKELVSVGLQAS
jgi:hypothetical protein